MKNTRAQHVMTAARDQGVSAVLFRNAIGQKLNLSVTESECLSFLSITGGATPTQIGRYTGLTSGSTTALLDRLEKAGYLERQPNPDDRRGSLIRASDHYKEATRPLVMGVQKAHLELIASYSDAELETIIDFLTRFTDNVTTQTQKINEE